MSENLDTNLDTNANTNASANTNVNNKITAKSDVIMHLDIRLKDGSIAESSREMKKPVSFKMGGGIFSNKFESELMGLSVGDKKKVMLMPEDAFGQPHPANIFQVPKDKFAGFSEPLEVGLIIEFPQINGIPQLGIIRKIEEEEIKVDFNHPLSGQVVLFDFELLEIK